MRCAIQLQKANFQVEQINPVRIFCRSKAVNLLSQSKQSVMQDCAERERNRILASAEVPREVDVIGVEMTDVSIFTRDGDIASVDESPETCDTLYDGIVMFVKRIGARGEGGTSVRHLVTSTPPAGGGHAPWNLLCGFDVSKRTYTLVFVLCLVAGMAVGFGIAMLLGVNATDVAEPMNPAQSSFFPTDSTSPHHSSLSNVQSGSPSPVPQQSEGPSSAPLSCEEGRFVDCSRTQHDTCSKCSPCPVDSFSASRNADFDCQSCPSNSSTFGETGSTICIRQAENFINPEFLVVGYVLLTINWALALFCGCWTVLHRNSPIIKTGELGFFLLICCGTMLSSSAILMLSFEAGEGQDTRAATSACVAVPWLYWTGLTLQHSCLYAKTCWLLYRQRRGNLQASSMYPMIAAIVAVTLIGLSIWAVFDPVQVCDLPLVALMRHASPLTLSQSQHQVSAVASTGCLP